METNPDHPDSDRDAIDAAIAAYRPTCLDPDHAAQALPRLRELTRAVGPRSVVDATCVLSSACRFLADVVGDVVGDADCDVDRLLPEARVSRWSHAWKAAGKPQGTLANHLGRLNRLLRAKAGHAPQPRQAGRPREHLGPYPPEDLLSVATRLAGTDRAAAAAVGAGAGAGVVVPAVVGAAVRVDGSGVPVLVTADGGRHGVVPAWGPLARGLVDVTIDGDAWVRARHQPAGATKPLDSRRLRLSWAVAVLDQDLPVAETLTTAVLGRTTIDRARPHLGVPDAEAVTALLRG